MHARLVGLGVVLGLVAGGGLVVDHTGAARAEAEQRREDSRSYAAALLPDRPIEVPRIWVQALHRDDYTGVCFLLDATAGQQFAAARGERDCTEAARGLAAEIRPGYALQYVEYLSVGWSSVKIAAGGKSATVDACALRWESGVINPRPMPPDGAAPGPQLGRLVVTHVPGVNGGGFRVTGYQACPASASGASTTLPAPTSPGTGAAPTAGGASATTDAPTTTAGRRGLLPTYAKSFGALLAARIADGRSVCAYFSPEGRDVFARAWGTADCEAASAALSGRVVDPRRYRSPLPAAVVDGPRGPVVDACSLRWPSLDRSAGAPGPQLGRLHLERPGGAAGYWITGYERC
jgi:hypothetical protein